MLKGDFDVKEFIAVSTDIDAADETHGNDIRILHTLRDEVVQYYVQKSLDLV